eukprot:13159672-Alexandrium_andersonii.AAC.1
MSASLVGSEMCIRDRPTAMCCCCPIGAGRPSRSPGLGGQGVEEIVGVAVSYTHLTLPTICSV